MRTPLVEKQIAAQAKQYNISEEQVGEQGRVMCDTIRPFFFSTKGDQGHFPEAHAQGQLY